MRNLTINGSFKALVLTAALLLLNTTLSHADQNSPQLDTLFAALHEVGTTPEDARLLTSKIWNQWLQNDDRRAQQLMALGVRRMNQYALQEALNAFSSLIRLAPDFAEAWNKRATVYFMMGEFDLATADVSQTLALEPRHFGALSGQGLIYLHTDKKAAALQWFRRALEVNPFMESVRESVKLLDEELNGKII